MNLCLEVDIASYAPPSEDSRCAVMIRTRAGCTATSCRSSGRRSSRRFLPAVFIVPPDPKLREVVAGFVAALGHEIEVVVGRIQYVDPARVGRVGVKHSALRL